MADETKQAVAATDDVKDDLLSKAAAEAVADQDEKKEITEEIKEVEEKIEKLEEDSEGLPKDQKERSQLGRTLAALHRRLDDFDQRDAERDDQIQRLIDAMEKRKEPEDDFDDDAPLTRAELKAALKAEREAEKAQEQKLTKEYHKGYSLKWAELSKGLSAEEYNAILAEAEEMKYDPSDNAAFDAALNFKEAQLRHLKKQLASKKSNPLDKNTPKDGIGTVTTQKVPDREIALPKLDDPAQSYLNYISREDGADRAAALHKSLAK
jgi:hypothetical protein